MPARKAGHLKQKKRFYIQVRGKFILATSGAACWFFFSLWISERWIEDLSKVTGEVLAFLIILFIALIPGFLMAHLLLSIVLDRQPYLDLDIQYPPITLLMAAYNEEENLPETFRGIREVEYTADIEIIVVDDGSTDGTVDLLRSFDLPNLKVIQVSHGGKAHALNEGLKATSNGILVTIDADTFLQPQSLKRIVARLLSDPPGTAAVAGSVLVRNSRTSFMTRLQEWDYYAAIASVKRQQGLFQGALVAQGAFSAFHTVVVRQHQGWPSVVGEDIVMTWALLKSGYRVGYEPTAVGFTITPTDLGGFYRQRKRWARGMIEGLKTHGDITWKRPHLPAYFVAVDFLFPFLDCFYVFAFIPGIILAFTGRFYIVGPITLLVLPLTFLVVWVMYVKEKQVFDTLGLKVRRNRLGLILFMIIYQFIMSPTCVVGYTQELLGFAKKW